MSDAEPLQRIALGVEYDGSQFAGWQRQGSPRLPTLQAALEEALSSIADVRVTTVCAGRTDRGVHATGQVAHFDTPIDRGEKAWVMGTNTLLPDAIRVHWAKAVGSEFHARFSATARRYLYLLCETPVEPALMRDRQLRVRGSLNVDAMHRAAQYLVGEHDFSAFRAAGCQSRSPRRCVQRVEVRRFRRYLVVDIQANAFLYNMVRNIVGTLLEVGRGQQPAEWIRAVLQGGDRTLAGDTAPPWGLYLVNVQYPGKFGLPELPVGPLFLQPYA